MSALSNDQGRAYDDSLDYINYNDQRFPCRYIQMNDDVIYLVSVESLNKVIYDDAIEYVSAKAQSIDEEIFFFLKDSDITRPTHKIVKILNKVIV